MAEQPTEQQIAASQIADLLRAKPSTQSQVNAPPVMAPPQEGIQKFARPGVELDVTQGAPLSTRINLSFAQSEQDKVARLRNAFSGSEVVPIGGDQFIIRNVLDESTGKPKDLLVDEKGFSMKDFGDMASAIPEVAGEILALKGLGFLPKVAKAGRFARTAMEAATAAGGAQTAGALVDAGQVLFGVGDMEGGQIVRQRAARAATEGLLGFGMGAGLQGVLGAVDTARGRSVGVLAPGEAERSGLESIRSLRSQTGEELMPTLGQMANDQNVLRLESFVSRIPFLGRAFNAQMERQAQSLRRIQRKAFGEEPLQPLAEMGAGLTETIKSVVSRPDGEAKMLSTRIVQRAADELESALSRIDPSAKVLLTPPGTAAVVKGSAQAQFGRFRETADILFGDVGNPEISTEPLKGLLGKVKESLPKKTVLTESDIKDVAGKPLATTEGKEIVRELVPGELLKFINGLETLDSTMPLNELRRVRNTVDDAISEGRGLEGVSTRDLKQVQRALTETIDRGVKSLDDDTAEKLTRANAFYRENIERFETPLIARLLKQNPADAGFLQPYELVQSIRKNPDTYNTIETFLKGQVTEGGRGISGSAEKTMNLVRRSVLEDVFDRSKVVTKGGKIIVDADSVIKELNNYPKEIKASLLGGEAQVVERNLNLLSRLKDGYKDVKLDDLEAFLTSPNSSVQDLSNLGKAVRESRELFQKNVVKKFLAGDIDSSKIDAKEALDWLMSTATKADAQEFLTLVSDNPVLTESFRRHAVARVFQDAAQKAKPADAARLGSRDRDIAADKIIENFRDDDYRTKIKMLVGPDRFNILDAFVRSQSVLGKKAGQTLVGSNSAMQILTDVTSLVRNVPATAKYLFYGLLMTNPALQKKIMEGATKPGLEMREFTMALVASPPVLEAFAEEYGQTGTEMIMELVRNQTVTDKKETVEPKAAGSQIADILRQRQQNQ